MPPPPFDPRVTPARPDLAAESLRGKVEAARFVAGEALPRRRAERAAAARARRRGAARDRGAATAKRSSSTKSAATGAGSSSRATATSAICRRPRSGRARAPTHASPRCAPTPIPAPTIKRPPRFALSLGALVAVARFEGDFAVTADGLLPLRPASRADRRARARFRRRRRAFSRDALSVGRAHQRGDRLLRPGADRAGGGGNRRAARQRHAGGGARRSRCRSTTRSRICGAAIWCSGRATSASCATRRRCCTPTAGA